MSRDRKLIILSLLHNARRHYNVGGLQDNINKAGNMRSRHLTWHAAVNRDGSMVRHLPGHGG